MGRTRPITATVWSRASPAATRLPGPSPLLSGTRMKRNLGVFLMTVRGAVSRLPLCTTPRCVADGVERCRTPESSYNMESGAAPTFLAFVGFFLYSPPLEGGGFRANRHEDSTACQSAATTSPRG